jgi:hypothetical protein
MGRGMRVLASTGRALLSEIRDCELAMPDRSQLRRTARWIVGVASAAALCRSVS